MTAIEPDDARIAAVQLLDQHCDVLAVVKPVRCDIGLELEASEEALARCWFLRGIDAAGAIVETRTTELGLAMAAMRLGPRRKDE